MVEVILEHVTKKYDNGFTAVEDLNLRIKDKEFVVLVGPSGCGKTTTLRMIAGLEEISSGKIIIGDNVVNDLKPKDRNIAMVFQSYALYPHMSVYDNMSFALKMQKRPKDEIDARVKEAASILGIEDQLNKKPRELSGGQRQRVALGRAIVRKPAVFLMDEPLSNLDAKLRVKMRIELKRIHQRLGATTIYVTHDQMEAMTLADKMAVMNKGLLQQYSSPLQAYNKPANKFVAGFVGSPAMNFLEGSLSPSDNGYRFEASWGKFEMNKSVAEALIESKLNKSTITYGIRPEDVKVYTSEMQNALPAVIYGIELLGDSSLAYIRLDENTEIIAQVAPDLHLGMNDRVYVDLSSNKAHIFDYEGIAIV